jgi:hypothetical protein
MAPGAQSQGRNAGTGRITGRVGYSRIGRRAGRPAVFCHIGTRTELSLSNRLKCPYRAQRDNFQGLLTQPPSNARDRRHRETSQSSYQRTHRDAAGHHLHRRRVRVRELEPVVRVSGAVSITPLFANKLLRRTVEIATGSTPRCPHGTGRCGRSRNAGVLAEHCLCVAIDLTREGCCIHGWRSEGHRRRSLAGLSEKLGWE